MNPTLNVLGATELHDVLNFAPVGVLVEDCAGRVVWLNHTLEWLLGIDRDEMLGAHASSLPLDPIPGAKGKRLFRAPLDWCGGKSRHLKCIEDILPEYSETGIRVRYFLETRGDDTPRGFRNNLLRMLGNRGHVDRVTGVQDETGILGTLRSEVSRSRRYGNPLSVVVMQTRQIAQTGTVVNHPSLILATASGLLKDCTRWADSVGRLDDYGFLLVLPETTAPAARQLVRKVKAAIEAGEKVGPGEFAGWFGIAEWCRGDDDTTLLRRAEQALAKSVGL